MDKMREIVKQKSNKNINSYCRLLSTIINLAYSPDPGLLALEMDGLCPEKKIKLILLNKLESPDTNKNFLRTISNSKICSKHSAFFISYKIGVYLNFTMQM